MYTGFLEIGIAIAVLIILTFLIPAIFFLINLSKTISVCAIENQTMTPGLVWLNFIPLFSLGWIIYTVLKVNESVKKEYISRNKNVDELKSTQGVGLAFAICIPCSIIPIIGILSSIASFVLMIIYWVKTYNIRMELAQSNL